MPAVSVIIPIYNAQPYLRQCLDSIRNQTLSDIEVLCVNDGSTDDSLDVLREYAELDERFIVLDKPNGGYGHSLNYGMARAQGEFISIIEPDDFIHPRMYEGLTAFADFEGEPADIVKGSYCEFFDGADGFEDQFVAPNLMAFMKPIPHAFTLEEDTTVIAHHPSIWSAIYRRSFIEENGIRFVEPKGAGWADNPFLFETMVSAKRIVWVPKAYYYYRQTNPGASSFLKDYHMPFDRLRDIEAVLHERNASTNVWAAFYLREFFYIESIIGEFGFDEADPELKDLITEAFERMDSAIVLTHDMIPSKFIAFYKERLALAEQDRKVVAAPSREILGSERPILTYIIPVGDNARYALQSLESLTSQPIDAYEVIVVDNGSTDRTLDICRNFAADNPHFRFIDVGQRVGADALNYALEQARGYYGYIYSLEYRFRGDAFARALLAAAECSVDIMLLDRLCRSSVDALRVSGGVEPYEKWMSEGSFGLITKPFIPAGDERFILNCSEPRVRCALFNMQFVRDAGIWFNEADEASDRGMLLRALICSPSVSYMSAPFIEELYYDFAPVPFYLDIHDWHVRERPLVLPSALAVATEAFAAGMFEGSARLLVLDSLIDDLNTRETESSLRGYYEKYLPLVSEVVKGAPGYDWRHDGGAFSEYALLENSGLEEYLLRHFLMRGRALRVMGKNIEDTLSSRTYQIGMVVKELAKILMPNRLVAQMRGDIAEEQK